MLRIGQVETTATSDGLYTDGSVAGGIAATRLRASAFNAMQEELAHIVEEGGDALSIDDMTQVLKALKKLFLSRSNPFGDIALDGPEAIATALSNLGIGEAAKLGVAKNSDMQTSPGSVELLTTVAAVMSVLPTRAMSPTDYVRIPDKPGGLIIQWGITPIIPKASWVDVTFPIPFPSSFLSLMAIFKEANSGCIEYRPYSGASLLTGCQIGEGGAAHYSGSNRAIYIAIGQ
ncbi:gp53-like domain-containing protein [Citrobacter freundii complex sp. CFNIH2]|uniref:gp53-like domain-containing protein n=1 Tax=Citrobacter freundii complex sp. CFNIH2 TaxID=2066049 RepID=UPI0021CBA78C|nr:hypothetical protein [Citrobacter freundii complex sp. CFNIH2]